MEHFDPKQVDYNSVAEPKVLRIFGLIALLQHKSGYTIEELAHHLDKDKRTVYRYFKLLEQLKYDVDCRDGRHFLVGAVDGPRRSFTKAELNLLNTRLVNLGDSNPLVASLRLKLKLTSAQMPLPSELLTLNQSRFVEALQEAIAHRVRVQIIRYNTTTETGEEGNRVVEPQSLTDNLSRLIALETKQGQPRTFTLSRMQGVTILYDEPCQFPYIELTPDLFGMADVEKAPQFIILQLTERAYQLLIHEFPAAYPFCETLPDKGRKNAAKAGQPVFLHQFRCEARGYEGIGRFVMGLPTEIKVVEPAEFRTFVREKSALAAW